MALDEPTDTDEIVEEAGIQFLFDAKSAPLFGDLVIDYDKMLGFSIEDESY
ncbi:MAG TPA: hypothetical protein VFV52_02860 [Bacilli bacterium]|nr:hypothetical protein [Bacilli bacterium]